MIITTIITIASSSSILISSGATIGMRWGSNELEVEEGDGVSWVTWHIAMLCYVMMTTMMAIIIIIIDKKERMQDGASVEYLAHCFAVLYDKSWG